MGYPVSKALAIGCLSCTEYLDDHDMSVMIVVYDSSEAHRLSEEVSSFMIDNSYSCRKGKGTLYAAKDI